MLVDKASLEIVVMPFVVLRDTPAAAARLLLISPCKCFDDICNSLLILTDWIVVIFPVDIFAVVMYALFAPTVKVKTSSDDT